MKYKLALIITMVAVLGVIFSAITVFILKPVPKTSELLRDFTTSYSFLDDVYIFDVPSLKGRLENWANYLHLATSQSICLSATFSNFQDNPEISISVCSKGAKLSELARSSRETGTAKIQLGTRTLGEIEWLTRSEYNYRLFAKIYGYYLLFILSILTVGFVLFVYKRKSQEDNGESAVTASDVRQSLFRVMGSNRRTVVFHDNWVYAERRSSYIHFINLDGSKLRIRASLSDITTIFPGARYINRGALINTSVGVHQFRDQQVILTIKGEQYVYEIDPSYMEAISA